MAGRIGPPGSATCRPCRSNRRRTARPSRGEQNCVAPAPPWADRSVTAARMGTNRVWPRGALCWPHRQSRTWQISQLDWVAQDEVAGQRSYQLAGGSANLGRPGIGA
jgi:hypothetical protein